MGCHDQCSYISECAKKSKRTSADSGMWVGAEEGEISEGEEASSEPVEDEEMDEADADAEIEEEVLLTPDQSDLAKLLTGPNDSKNVSAL